MKALIICALLISSFAHARSIRIKDLVSIKGVRDNPIIGYGLVIGLNGIGDSGGEITNQSLKDVSKTGHEPSKRN